MNRARGTPNRVIDLPRGCLGTVFRLDLERKMGEVAEHCVYLYGVQYGEIMGRK